MKINEVTTSTVDLINEAVATGEISPEHGQTLAALNNPGAWSKGMTADEFNAYEAALLGGAVNG